MTLRHATLRPPTSPLWFAAPLVGIYVAALVLVEALPQLRAPGAIAAGLTADLVVLVPAVYYAVLIRGRGWPSITLAPVVLLSFGAARLIVPAEHHGLLSLIGVALPAVEVGLVMFVGVKAWRVLRANGAARAAGGDFYDRVRQTLRGAFDAPAVVGAFAYEASLAHYAFAVRREAPSEHAFTYHRRAGYGAILGALLMAAALELVGVHILLRSWSATAAWVHIGLSLYGIVWLVGDYRAMRRRPHELSDTGLRVRYGIRWDLGVDWDQVTRVHRTRHPAPGDDYLDTVPVGRPRYVVELDAPVEATGPYGVGREVQRIGLVVDEPDAFEARLGSLGVPIES